MTTPGSAGSTLCVDSSNQVTVCGGATFSLQGAYNGGNTITTTDARDIAFTLADTGTNSNFNVTTANGSTGESLFALGAGSNTTVPNQLIQIDNQNTSNTLPTGIAITSTGGGVITTGIDLSDTHIVTGINLGASSIAGTNFSVDGGTGNVTSAGSVAVNGGSLTTTSATANLFNTGATVLNIGGAATSETLGATTGTTTIRNLTLSLPNATNLNAANAAGNFSSLTTGGGYSSTGTTISSTGVISNKRYFDS